MRRVEQQPMLCNLGLPAIQALEVSGQLPNVCNDSFSGRGLESSRKN